MSSHNKLGDCPKRIYQIALNFCSYSRRDIRRIVNYLTDVATQKTDKKTSKVVNYLREIALVCVCPETPVHGMFDWRKSVVRFSGSLHFQWIIAKPFASIPWCRVLLKGRE